MSKKKEERERTAQRKYFCAALTIDWKFSGVDISGISATTFDPEETRMNRKPESQNTPTENESLIS